MKKLNFLSASELEEYRIVESELEDDDTGAAESLTKFLKNLKKNNNDMFNYTYDLSEANEVELKRKPIKMLGYISDFCGPFAYTFHKPKNKSKDVSAYNILIRDIDPAIPPVKTFMIIKDKYDEEVVLYKKFNGLLLFKGMMIDYIISTPHSSLQVSKFYLYKIDPDITPLDILKIREKRKDQVTEVFKKAQRNSRKVRGAIKETLINKLNIKGLDKAKELNDAIEFIILQAFSSGLSSDGRYSNALHSLIIGPPASGKKLLTQIARLLNPIADEVQANKVTEAGLIATSKGKTSLPGYLPLNSLGVLCIQDYHDLKNKRTAINSILAMAMEDGKVIDSTQSRTTHSAITSIHLDTNRITQVRSATKINNYDDVNIPYNLISRFDLIIEIPENIERQADVALAMVGESKTLESKFSHFRMDDGLRELRAIIAYLSTNFRFAQISQEISDYIRANLKEIIDENKKYNEVQKHFASMLTRMEISIEKLAKAIACADQKIHVNKEHVDEAFEFINYKLKFLATIEPTSIPISKKEKKRLILKENFGYKKITVKDIGKFLENESDPVSDKTIQRWIKSWLENNLIKKISHGVYKFPEENSEKEEQ